MRTLYDIIYDETKVRYLKWKASLHTITYLSKMDFMKTIHDDIEWIVFSMWILIRANHKRPNERIDKFKERFNEAISLSIKVIVLPKRLFMLVLAIKGSFRNSMYSAPS